MTGSAVRDRPAHIPQERVRDVDIYDLPGSERDVHDAWMRLAGVGAGWLCETENGWWQRSNLMAHPSARQTGRDNTNASSRCEFLPRSAP